MITSSDKDYKLTKLIKQGKATIDNDFRPLADWIDKTYDVQTMNIIYDTILDGKTPRLEIVFEFSTDRDKFYDGDFAIFNFNPEKQLAIANQFKKTLQDQGLVKKDGFLDFLKGNNPKYRTDGLFVIYDAFEPMAREEANVSVPRERIDELKNQIGNKDIWHIITFFSAVVFFFYTDEQVKENTRNGVKEELSERYFNLLKQYDEFSYFNKESFSVSLDSKEKFDNKYQSNWYNYMH